MKILCRRHLFILFLIFCTSIFKTIFPATPIDTNLIKSAIQSKDTKKIRDYLDAKKNNFDLAHLISSFPNDAPNSFFIVLLDYIKGKGPSESIQTVKQILKKITPTNYMLFKSFLYQNKDLKEYLNVYRISTCRKFNIEGGVNSIEYKEIEKLFILDVICHDNISSLLNSFISNKNFILTNLIINDITHPIEIKLTENVIQESITTFNNLTPIERKDKNTKIFYINLWRMAFKNGLQKTNNNLFVDFYKIVHDLKSETTEEENTQKVRLKLNKIDLVENQLLSEFSGWDETIKNIMSVVKKIELLPRSENLPLVIPLIGPSGYGKTTLIQRLVELMGWQGIFQYYPLTYPTAIPPNIENENSGNGGNDSKFKSIILYDDIQNIVPYDDIDINNQINKYNLIFDKYDIKFRVNFNDKLYRILNNGTIESASNYSFNKYISELSKHADTLKIYYNNIRMLEFKIDSYMEESNTIKDRYEKEISSIETIKLNDQIINRLNEQIQQNKIEMIKSYYTNEIELLMEELTKDFPEIFKSKEFKGVLPFYDFTSNPFNFIQKIQNYYKHTNSNKKTLFNNTIIFFSGTPTHLINKVNHLYRENTENQIDPDLYVDKFKELIQPTEISQWVVDILGHYNHELHSLVGVHRFKLNLPLNSKQWIELIQKMLSIHQDEFKKLADQYLLKGTLDFDQSVLLLLYREGVAPLSGPRALSSTDTELMGSFANKIIDALRDKGVNDFEKLTVFYQIKNQKHYLTASNNKGLSIDFPIGIHYKFNSKDIQQIEAIKERQALHWAGFTVVGTTLFKSLPRKIENRSIESLEEVHFLWKAPAIFKWEYTKNLVLTYLGAYACECEFMNNHFRTKMATLFYPIILKLLHELKENFELARQSIQHQKNRSKPSLEEILPQNLQSDPFYHLVDQEEYDKVIDDLLDKAKSIVKENQTLISALANELVQKNSLNNNQLKDIYLYNLRIYREKSWPLWLVETITGFKIKSDYITPPYLEAILKHSPDEMPPIEVLELPYNYPQPKMDPLNFTDIAEEFFDQLYFGKTF